MWGWYNIRLLGFVLAVVRVLGVGYVVLGLGVGDVLGWICELISVPGGWCNASGFLWVLFWVFGCEVCLVWLLVLRCIVDCVSFLAIRSRVGGRLLWLRLWVLFWYLVAGLTFEFGR